MRGVGRTGSTGFGFIFNSAGCGIGAVGFAGVGFAVAVAVAVVVLGSVGLFTVTFDFTCSDNLIAGAGSFPFGAMAGVILVLTTTGSAIAVLMRTGSCGVIICAAGVILVVCGWCVGVITACAGRGGDVAGRAGSMIEDAACGIIIFAATADTDGTTDAADTAETTAGWMMAGCADCTDSVDCTVIKLRTGADRLSALRISAILMPGSFSASASIMRT